MYDTLHTPVRDSGGAVHDLGSDRYRVGGVPSLSTALTIVGSNAAVLQLSPGVTVALTGPATIPDTALLSGQMGTIDLAGYPLTVYRMSAGLWPVFEDSVGGGQVILMPGAVDHVRPHWWGYVGNGNADTTPFLSAIAAAKEIGAPVEPGPGRFRVKNLSFTEGTATADMLTKPVAGLVGTGPDVTVFCGTDDMTADDWVMRIYHPTLGGPSGTKASGGIFDGFSVDGNFRSAEHHGIAFDGSHYHIGRIHVRNVNGHGVLFGRDKVAREIFVQELHVRSCGRHTGAGGSSNAAAFCIGVPTDDTTECNNIKVAQLDIVYPWYAGIQIIGTDAMPSRDFYFTQLELHGHESASQQGRLHSDAAMFDCVGPVSNISTGDIFLTRVSTDDAGDGLGLPCWAFRFRNGGETLGPNDVNLGIVHADTSTRGGLIRIESARRIVVDGVRITGNSTDYPAGHLVADEGSFTELVVNDANFSAALTVVYYSDGNNVRDGVETVVWQIPADAAASTTYSALQIFGASKRRFIHKIVYSPSAAVTANASNYARIRAYRKPPGSAEQVAELLTDVTSLSAYVKYDLTLTDGTKTQLDTDNFLGVQISKNGTGVQLPAGVLIFTLGKYVKTAEA